MTSILAKVVRCSDRKTVLSAPLDATPKFAGEATANLGGRELQFVDGKLEIGRDATVSWDSRQGTFKLYDHSTEGTYVRHAGSSDWELVKGRDITLKPSDEVRLPGEGRPELKLTAPPAAESVVADTGNPNVRLYLGNQPLGLDANGDVVVGRNVEGPSGVKLTDDPLVSRDHGTLRYDSSNDTYYYRDHWTNDHPTNGTYINGEHILGREVVVRPTDEIHLGSRDGAPLKLVSMKPPVTFAGIEDAVLYIDGKQVPITDGPIEVGRNFNSSISDLRVSRDQGTLQWNQTDKSFYFLDKSRSGTFVLNGDNYEPLPKGQWFKVSPEADIRLGSSDGPKLELFSKATSGSVSATDHQMFVNGQEVNTSGPVSVGSSFQTFGANDVLTNLVSNNHGTLNIDESTGKYTIQTTPPMAAISNALMAHGKN